MFPRAPEIEQFQEQGIDTLVRLPFTPAIGSGAAAGCPVAGDSDSPLSGLFAELAQQCRDRMVQQQREMLT